MPLSKAYSLAGLRVGYAVSTENNRMILNILKEVDHAKG